MARLSTYKTTSLEDNDYILGTDSTNNETKSYTAVDIKNKIIGNLPSGQNGQIIKSNGDGTFYFSNNDCNCPKFVTKANSKIKAFYISAKSLKTPEEAVNYSGEFKTAYFIGDNPLPTINDKVQVFNESDNAYEKFSGDGLYNFFAVSEDAEIVTNVATIDSNGYVLSESLASEIEILPTSTTTSTTTTTTQPTTTTTTAATTTTTTATQTTTTTSTTTAAPTTTTTTSAPTTTTTTASPTTTTTTAPTTTTTTIISQNQTPGTVVDTDYYKLNWIRRLDYSAITIGDPYGAEFAPVADDGWTATPSKITDLQGTGPYSSLGNRGFKLDTPSLQVGAFITDTFGTFINSNNTHSTTYNKSYSDFSTPMYAAVKTSLRNETIVDETLLVKVEQYNGYVRITELIDISSTTTTTTTAAPTTTTTTATPTTTTTTAATTTTTTTAATTTTTTAAPTTTTTTLAPTTTTTTASPNGYTYIEGIVGAQLNLGSAGSVTGANSSIPFAYHTGSNYVSITSHDYIIVNSPSFEEAKRIYDNGIITNGGTFQYNYIDVTFLDKLQVGTILYARNRVQDSNYNTFDADLAVDFLRLIDQGGGSYTGYNVGDNPSVQNRYILRYPNYGTDGNGNAWWVGIDSTTSAITDIIEESEFNSLATKEFYFTQNAATVADAANPTLEELNSVESLNLNTGYTSAQDVLTEKHLLWSNPTATTNTLATIINGDWYGFIKEQYFVDSTVTDINWNGWLKSSSTKTPNSSGSTLGKEVASIITNQNYIDRSTFSPTNFFPVFTQKSNVFPIINISSNTTEAIDLENTLPRVGTTRQELGYAWSEDGNKIALATSDNSGSKVYWANVGDSSWTDIGIPAGKFFNSGIQSIITWEGNTVYICIRNKYIYSYDTVAATGWVEDNGSAAIASAGYLGFFADLDWAAINRVKISDGTYIWAGIGYRNSSTLNVVYGSSLTAMQEDFVKSRAGDPTTNPVGVLSLNSNNGVYILENVGDMLYAHHNNSTINITIGNTAWSNSFGTYRHVVGKSDGSELMITANTSVYQYASDGVNFTQYTPNITNQAWYSGSEAWECVYDQINDIWFLVTRTYVSQEPGGKVIYTKTPSDVNSWKIAHLNRSSYVSNAFENAICKPRYTTPAPKEFGQTYTFLNGGGLSVYEDNYPDESLSSAGDPYYFINFGPGTSDEYADARALDYVKNAVAWLTNQSASNILLDTNYTITSSDFTRVTLGAHFGEVSTNVIAWVEPASSGTSVSISRSYFASRKYAIRFNGGWTANPGLNTDGNIGAGVAGVWWKKIFPTTTTTTAAPTTTTTAAPTTTTTTIAATTTTTTAATTTTTTTAAPEPNTFNVTNNGSVNYVINGAENPTLELIEGQAYTFNINAVGHPFWIKTVSSTGTGDAYNSGVTNNGTDNGTITFVVPYDAPSTLYYNCQFHIGMAGIIAVTEPPDCSIEGTCTATQFNTETNCFIEGNCLVSNTESDCSVEGTCTATASSNEIDCAIEGTCDNIII